MQQQQHFPTFNVTPHGIIMDGMPLTKSVRQNLPVHTLRSIARMEELLKKVKKEDWDNRTPHSMHDIPMLAQIKMIAALASPQPYPPLHKQNLQELAKDAGDDSGDEDDGDDGTDSGDDFSDDGADNGGDSHYNPDEPRVPAGYRNGGQWTDGGDFGPPSAASDRAGISADDAQTAPETAPSSTREYQVADSEQIMTDAIVDNDAAASTGTNPSGPIRIVHDVPADAVYYHTATDDTPFWAPPAADWPEVYAAGQANSWPAFDPLEAEDALGHFGIFDFQRDSSTNTFYTAYTNASNYAVGVYMYAAGSSYSGTFEVWLAFSGSMSSNAWSSDQWFWIKKGWTDAQSGKLAVAQ